METRKTRRIDSRAAALVLASAAFVALIAAADTAGFFGLITLHHLTDAGWTLCALVAVAGCISATRRSDGLARQGWIAFTLGTASWLAGQLAWDYYDLAGHFPASPNLSDIAWIALVPCFVIGLLIVGARSGQARLLLGLDMGVILQVSGLVYPAVFWSEIQSSTLSTPGLTTALLYPILYSLLPFALLLLPVREIRHNFSMLALFVGLLGQVLPFILWTPLLLAGTYREGTLLDVMWMIGLLSIAGAGFTFERFPSLDPERQVHGTLANLSLALTGVAALLLVWRSTDQEIARGTETIFVAVTAAAIALTSLRQILTNSSSRRLFDRARTLLDRTREAQRELLESEGRLAAIVAAQREIAETHLDLDAAHALVAGHARRLTRADGAAVDMLDGDILHTTVGVGTLEAAQGLRVPLKGSIAAWCARTGWVARVDDAETDRRVNGEIAWRYQERSLIVVPLLREEQLVGVLRVASIQPSAFGQREVQTVQLLASALSAAISNAAAYQANQQMLAERTATLETVQHQALHDAMTGLPNRALLHDRLDQAARSSHRRGVNFALFLMDLDGFKDVNDSLGHHRGDQLLREVAGRLDRVLRDSDTVARLGGDEFALVVTDVTAEEASLVAAKVLKAVQEPVWLGEQSVVISGSIGIALYPDHGEDATALLQHADIAMYDAKRSGIGCAVYDPGRDIDLQSRLVLLSGLRQALELDQFRLLYQPVLDLSDGHVQAFEVLLRWEHPERGLVSPDEFVPLAERSGLISPLTMWVVERALDQQEEWTQRGWDGELAVNLSARALHDRALADALVAQIRDRGLAPGRFSIEITESALMEDPELARATIQRLHDLGVRIAIDDFGTGYSSLSYLRRLPLTEIKIDRAFVRDLATNENDAIIVRSIIDLGHNLSLSVVAEGAEDRATMDRLALLGCDRVQGYYVSMPVPADQAEEWWLPAREQAVGE
ncbi:MAG TPA: EAL domain-containing protein [Chloroflexota bacterium]|nr:EAL domain-containing protein [Chloroflexota bacterium]